MLHTLLNQNIMTLSNDKRLIEKIYHSLDQETEKLISLVGNNLEPIYNQIKNINLHILILDISSSNNFSFDLLKKLDYQNFEIIFISDNTVDAVKTIPYQPIDYLLKPVNKMLLKKAVKRAIQNVEKNILFKILIDKYGDIEFNMNREGLISFPILKGRTIKLALKDIIRLEADGVLSRVFLRQSPEEHIKINIPIKNCELLLRDQNFFRIHRQHLINLDAINPFSNNSKNTIKLFTKEVLPVARRRQLDFESALFNYRRIKNG